MTDRLHTEVNMRPLLILSALVAALGMGAAALAPRRAAPTTPDGTMPEVLVRATAPRLVMPEVVVRPGADCTVVSGREDRSNVN
jgi:hypothetical protein